MSCERAVRQVDYWACGCVVMNVKGVKMVIACHRDEEAIMRIVRRKNHKVWEDKGETQSGTDDVGGSKR